MIEGKVLSEMKKVWKEIAVSEARINLLAELKYRNLGFNTIEKFSLELVYSLKSEKMKDKEKPVKSVAEAALKVIYRDEVEHCKELKRRREKMKEMKEREREVKERER